MEAVTEAVAGQALSNRTWTYARGASPEDKAPLQVHKGRTGTRTRRAWYEGGRWHVSITYTDQVY